MPDLDATKPTLKGSIAIWSGLIADIPDDWLLCDGTQSTPDLRSKFVKCVPDTVTDPGATGGEDTHVLTIAELPIHSHGITDPTHTHTKGTFSLGGSAEGSSTGTTSNEGTSATTTGLTLTNSGSGTAHENRPAFFELLYIMKGI